MVPCAKDSVPILPQGATKAAAIVILALLVSVHPMVAGAWTLELKNALIENYLGNATQQQKLLIRRSNDVVNNMANLGHIPDKVYQSAQEDFAAFNENIARKAGRRNGLSMNVQTRTNAFAGGTDSDYIMTSRSGRMTVKQIEQTIGDYNSEMNRALGTKNVNYAKKLNTDFMADPAQMTDAEFAEVAKINNDAYKRRGSADYEAKIRKPGSHVTVEETMEYQQDMNDLIAKKRQEIDQFRRELDEAFKSDPMGRKPATRNLKAKLQIRQQQQAKYIKRFQDATNGLADRYGVRAKPGVTDLAKKAADRSFTGTEGATEEETRRLLAEKARTKRVKTAAAQATHENMVSQAKSAKATVATEAARNIQLEAGNIPEADLLLDEAATEIASLPPAKQGEVLAEIRARVGDEMAQEITARTRRLNSAASAARRKAAHIRKAKEFAGKYMQVIMIAAAADTVRRLIKGEMSNIEAAETAANLVSMGSYEIGKNLAGWKQAYDSNFDAYVNNRQARIYQIAKDLHDRGVGLDEIRRIMSEMENGSEAGLDRKIAELNASGAGYTKPTPVRRTFFSDTTWTEYFKGAGGRTFDLAKGILLMPFKLAWDTGTDLGEIRVLTTDLYKEHSRIKDSYLQLINIQNEISARKFTQWMVAHGASEQEVREALKDWMSGKAEGMARLRALRDVLDIAALPQTKVMDAIRGLGDKKLHKVLDHLGVKPAADFYNCLCVNAHYGTSSTAQFYHPDTLGEFDERYSCQHPGPPCIVKGFGCGRHALPSGPKIWEGCLETSRVGGATDENGEPVPGSGIRLDQLILDKLRARSAGGQ